MREVTKSTRDIGRSGWDDVGGLVDIQKAIKEVSCSYHLQIFHIYPFTKKTMSS